MADLKKICLLIPSHYSGANGGAEYQVMFVLDALCQTNNYDIHYLCRRVAPDFAPRGYQIRKVGRANGLNRFGLFIDAFNVYKALKEIAPHIIYQNVGCAYTGIAAMYAKKYGAKLIWHIASDNDVEPVAEPIFKHRLTKSLDRLFLNYGIRNADIIAGQTKHQSDLLRMNFGRKCNILIPVAHPFPEHEIKKSEKVIVLWVGNLKLLKQPEIFVRLAGEISRTNNVSFVMMGRPAGPEKWFNNLIEQILHVPNLEFLGEVSQDEVNRRLREGHILVNTSRYEGFSNTFVQAWMRKVPVVSLSVDPDNILVRERIGFHSQTFKNLCNDVSRLIEDGVLRKKMGIRACRFARENHSVKKMVEKVTELF